MADGTVAGKVGGRHDHRPGRRLDAGDLVDGDPQFRLAVLAEDPPGRGTVERSAAVLGVPADDVMDRAATQAGHDLLAMGDGRGAVRAAGTRLAVAGSSVRIGRISQHALPLGQCPPWKTKKISINNEYTTVMPIAE